MLVLETINAQIGPLDQEAMTVATDKWNAVAKPIASLGKLETLVEQIAGITGSPDVSIAKRCSTILCSDNGVVAEHVTQGGSEITTAIAGNIARGISSINVMCKPAGIDAFAVDLGMEHPSADPRVLDRNVMRGTGDIMLGPAMSCDQALEAVQKGIDLVGELKAQGYELIATGEMGIGNTTTSSAMTSVFLGMTPEEVTGKGAGLSERDYRHKIDVVRRAVEVNHPDPKDPVDVLAKLGGCDIAGLAGMYIGGAVHRVPVIVDGFICTVGAYTAAQLCPAVRPYLIPSHLSIEPAVQALEDALGFDPVIHGGMHLGEGTGAVCLVPLLDMALGLYNGTTYEDTGIDAYEVDPQ